MRISKLYLVVCAAAICASFTTVRADDNPDQAAARAALEAKLHELSVQPAATNAQMSAPATATPPLAEKPQTTTSAMPEQPAQPATATTTMSSMAPMTAAPSAAPVQTMAPAPMAPSSDHGLFAPVPPPSGSIPAATAPEGNMPSSTTSVAPIAIQTPAPAAATAQAIPMEPPQTANAFYPGQELGLKPITAPPLPISPMQQAQLQALLDKYDANIVTPEQYQAARAKILAEHQ